MFSKKIVFILLLSIFFISLFLRVNRLDSFPAGFHIDEASLGYNAYSLLLTGKDENNNKFPLYIDMFGDQRPSGYHYLDTVFIKTFGLNEFATRLPGALVGSFTVFAIFLLVISIFDNKKLGLLSAFLLAISPWHVSLSRASSEPVVSLFFVILGFGLVLYSIKNNKKNYLVAGSIALSLSFFFYHTPRVFVPLFYLVVVLYYVFNKERKRIIHLTISFLCVSLTAVILVFFINGGSGRFKQVSIFGFPETSLVMNEQIREDGTFKEKLLTTRTFHNKIINYSLTFASNYFEYLNGDFLFIRGGLPNWYIIPNTGLIYLIEAPFLIAGFISIGAGKKNIYKLILLWVFVAPFTAALTVDDIPNVNRAIVLLPVLEILSAYGIIIVASKLPKKYILTFSGAVALFLIANFSYFSHQYFVHTAAHRNWYRNYGAREMMGMINASYNKVDKIIITKTTGGIYPLVLFYSHYDPAIYQKEGSLKDKDFLGFGKFIFSPSQCPSEQDANLVKKGEKAIFVDNGICEENSPIKNMIYGKDGSKAFRLVYR